MMMMMMDDDDEDDDNNNKPKPAILGTAHIYGKCERKSTKHIARAK